MALRARLYLVADAIASDRLEAALEGGVDIVQLRIKDGDDRFILEEAARFKAICDRHGVPLIINDRPDLAAAAGAAGVHVGQEDGSVLEARAIVGDSAIVGLSTHTPAQVDAAQELPLDYFAVGTIYATPTKPDNEAIGEDLIRYAADHARLPFFAIGGINITNVETIRAAGGQGIAVVRAITDAADPRSAAAELAAALRSEREPA